MMGNHSSLLVVVHTVIYFWPSIKEYNCWKKYLMLNLLFLVFIVKNKKPGGDAASTSILQQLPGV